MILTAWYCSFESLVQVELGCRQKHARGEQQAVSKGLKSKSGWYMVQSPVSNWAWVTDSYAQSVQPTPSTCEEQQMWDLPGSFFSYGWKDYRCGPSHACDTNACMFPLQPNS